MKCAHSPVIFFVAVSVALLLSVQTASGQSQTSSAIRGVVLIADDTPIVGATVIVRHAQTGIEKGSLSDAEGRFLLLLLQPGGPYDLTVSYLGYSDLTVEGIQLQVGETQTLTLYLSESAIEVEGIAVNVERDEIFNPGQVGPATLLNERMVQSVPILSRDVMELANLSPLVKTTENGGFSIAGQNDRYNQILIDGVTNKDAFGLTAGGVPGGQAGAKMLPIDAVAQYEILVAPFDVRLSGFTGGVMNAVTKTGTNDWNLRAFGVGRHEAFMGDLSLPTGLVNAAGVDRSLFGFSAGGPIIRDRAHFFISTEFEERQQPPTGFNLLRDDPALVQITDESMGAFQQLFDSQFGVDTGLSGPYALRQDLANIFVRVDATVAQGHRLTARTVFASANNEEAPNRTAFEPYELSSNAVLRNSQTTNTSVQLFSELGARGGNELEFSIQRTTDETTPASPWPQVEVELRSPVGNGTSYSRAVRTGSQFFAQENDLVQTSYRFQNTVTLPTQGGSTYTLGLVASLNSVEHQYLPGSKGDFYFASMNDLANNAPSRYQRTVLLPGQDPAVDFSVLEWGGYVQNEIAAGKGLTMRFGFRFDVPTLFDKPEYNPELDELFGFDTSAPPSGQVLLSPRWGFNWQSDGFRTTQVRGGAGFFTGQLPYVWLANAFHHNGLRSQTEVCTGRWTDDPRTGNTAPGFTPGTPPVGCMNGNAITAKPATVFAEDFEYPTYIKFSAIVDHEISDRLNGSLGFLFSHARKQVTVQEQNLDGPKRPLGSLEGYGGTARSHFGDATSTGFAPNRDHPEYDQVLLVTNGGTDWTYSFTAEARGYFSEDLAFQAGYSYARSFDRMSLTSADMISNFGLNATEGSPNQPSMTASNFDRPHKFVFSVYGRPFPSVSNTEFSLLYTAQSGLPFSYVYRGDLNGDGYPAFGPAFDRFNDLLYVPNVASEVPSGFATLALLGAALESDECLAANRGEILPRNACRAPWQHHLDLRVTHAIDVGGSEIRLEADMINVLNLINSEWGTIQSIRSNVPLLEPTARTESLSTTPGELSSRWAGGQLPARDSEGRLVPPKPWSVLTPDSNGKRNSVCELHLEDAISSTGGRTMQTHYFPTRVTYLACTVLTLGFTGGPTHAAETNVSANLLGYIHDEVTGRAIQGASVLFESMSTSRTTSALGFFTFTDVPIGVHFLRIEALGYSARRVQVRLSDNQSYETEVYLNSEAVELKGLSVEVIPRRTFNELRDLDIRLDRGPGQFILRTEIDQRGGNLISLLQGRRGVRVQGGGGMSSGRSVQLRRAQHLTSTAAGQHTIVACYPAVFVDGRRFSRRASLGDQETDLTEFLSSDMDVVEVYSGSSVPAVFGGGDAACGAILVWTRRGPQRRGGN